LNEYLYTYAEELPNEDKSKLNIANSIWFRDDSRLLVEADFLQKNADYYNASAYRSAFDAQAVKDINNWVKSNTDGMIDTIIDEIHDDVMLVLINAVEFDAEWETNYDDYYIGRGDFTDINGNIQNVDFMHSNEFKYLDDGKATGFIKPYYGNHYSFAALLPNDDISIESYIQSLTGSGFVNTIKNAEEAVVYASMPKFEYEYDIIMNEALINLGMPDAFDGRKANFKRMAKTKENIFIGEVLHKTYISVDKLGTKAGAATAVFAVNGSAAPPADPKTVRLDRPFVYAIIDNATNLPVFIGTLMMIND
jgi:serpin B